jgi:adenylate cyclase class IV
MRFFIDEETYKLFKTIYSNGIKELYKKRKNYFLWGILISIDTFNNWKKFIECKYEKWQSIWILYELFDILKINADVKITDHYLNIV